MLILQTSTWLPPSMHRKLTEHGRCCMQNNQLSCWVRGWLYQEQTQNQSSIAYVKVSVVVARLENTDASGALLLLLLLLLLGSLILLHTVNDIGGIQLLLLMEEGMMIGHRLMRCCHHVRVGRSRPLHVGVASVHVCGLGGEGIVIVLVVNPPLFPPRILLLRVHYPCRLVGAVEELRHRHMQKPHRCFRKSTLKHFEGEHLRKKCSKRSKRAGKGAVAAGLLIFHYPLKIKNTSLALSWHCRNAHATGPTTNHNITAASERAAKIGGAYLRNVMQQCSEGATNRVPHQWQDYY